MPVLCLPLFEIITLPVHKCDNVTVMMSILSLVIVTIPTLCFLNFCQEDYVYVIRFDCPLA